MARLTGYKATKEPVYSITLANLDEQELEDKLLCAIENKESFVYWGLEHAVIPYGVLDSLAWVIQDDTDVEDHF